MRNIELFYTKSTIADRMVAFIASMMVISPYVVPLYLRFSVKKLLMSVFGTDDVRPPQNDRLR